MTTTTRARSLLSAAGLLIALAACSPTPPADSSGSSTMDPAEAKFRSSPMLRDFPDVQYLDEHGESISYQTFSAKIGSGISFNMNKYPDRGTAVLQLASVEDTVESAATSPAKGTSRIAVGEALPAINGRSPDGDVVVLSPQAERPRLLSFYFDKCAPCIAEIPAINAFADKHPEIEVVAVTMDDADAAKVFIDAYDLKTRVVADAEDSIDAMGISTYPMLMLVSADGRLLASRQGAAGSKGDEDRNPLLLRILDKWASTLLSDANAAEMPGDSNPSGTSLPPFIMQLITDIQAESVRNPPAKLYRYLYRGHEVYFLPQHCCDMTSEVYTAEGEHLCAPDGGITGRGDGQCPDFFEVRSEETLIWEDNRKAGVE